MRGLHICVSVNNASAEDSYDRPTPFEVWRAKQQHTGKNKEVCFISSQVLVRRFSFGYMCLDSQA
jgi:hypothetical protein